MATIHTPTDNVKQVVLAQNVTATNATPSIYVDCLGYEQLLISVIANTSGGSGSVDVVVQDSADHSAWSASISGLAIANIGDAKTATTVVDPSTINIKLSKRRRYIRCPYTIAATASVTIVATLFNARWKAPTWTIVPISG